MFLESIVNGGVIPALEKMAGFTEARHRIIAENVANIDTPGYRTQRVSLEGFQRSLQEAFQRRRDEPGRSFEIEDDHGVSFDGRGFLQIEPSTRPPENLMFHDGTNAGIDAQMADLAKNGMMHQTVLELLKGQFDGLKTAIRGRVA